MGGPAAERCLAVLGAAGAALTAKTPSRGTPPTSSLLGFAQDPPRSRIGSCRLPGLSDDRLQPRSSQLVSRGVSSCRGDQLDQAGGNVPVGGIGEVDRIVFLPYRQ